ncbi:MAG: alpha/beta fold hydrolase, partial [Acetobacteraceae bacterium]
AVRCPALLVAGSRDTARPPEHVAATAARIAGARYLTLETGHVMAIETPRIVAAAILEFLEACCFKGACRLQENNRPG